MNFAVPADHRVKLKEHEKKDKYRGLARGLKKQWNMKVGFICSLYRHQRIYKGTGGLGNKRTSEDHPNYCIIEIGQNTEKSPGDLRFAVTKADVKNSQQVNQ